MKFTTGNFFHGIQRFLGIFLLMSFKTSNIEQICGFGCKLKSSTMWTKLDLRARWISVTFPEPHPTTTVDADFLTPQAQGGLHPGIIVSTCPKSMLKFVCILMMVLYVRFVPTNYFSLVANKFCPNIKKFKCWCFVYHPFNKSFSFILFIISIQFRGIHYILPSPFETALTLLCLFLQMGHDLLVVIFSIYQLLMVLLLLSTGLTIQCLVVFEILSLLVP